MPTPRTLLAVPAVGLALALGACGGDTIDDLRNIKDDAVGLREQAERLQGDLQDLQRQLEAGEINQAQFERRLRRELRGAGDEVDGVIRVLERANVFSPELERELEQARRQLGG